MLGVQMTTRDKIFTMLGISKKPSPGPVVEMIETEQTKPIDNEVSDERKDEV